MWLFVCGLASTALAEEPQSQIFGRVTDRESDLPLEGALVVVSGPSGQQTATTDADGRYTIAVRPGAYSVVLSYGKSRVTGNVTADARTSNELNGRLISGDTEVIVITERLDPAVKPEPKNLELRKTLPYSDRAILSNAWTRAWLLLDINETGVVSRFKFMKKPGYDLEKIAANEVRRLRFAPARDATGKPMAVLLVWQMDWPAAGWLLSAHGNLTRMPKLIKPGRAEDDHVPCAGSGPMHLESVRATYKDCSQPDLSKAVTEPWISR